MDHKQDSKQPQLRMGKATPSFLPQPDPRLGDPRPMITAEHTLHAEAQLAKREVADQATVEQASKELTRKVLRSRTPILAFFDYEHLPPFLQTVSKPIGDLAYELAEMLPPGPETTTGLRKLLEAKDCFVRAALPTPPTK